MKSSDAAQKESDAAQAAVPQRQSLPEFMRVLNEKELACLSNYTHITGKSTYEKWMIANPLGWIERMHPNFLSANSITIIGQSPLMVLVFVMLWNTNGNIEVSNDNYRTEIIIGGFLLQWFSLYDIMDGCRARRLNCGSPFGRIIDEAGDTVVMAHYSLLLAYAMGFKNCYLELMFFFMNFAFYCMEVKHKVTGKLVMAVGEISSVEVELFVACFIVYFGCSGNEVMQKSFGEHFGIEKDSTFYAIADYRFTSASVGSVLILLLAFLDDSLGDSMRVNIRETLKLVSPQAICMILYLAMSTLPSYQDHRAIAILFVNYVMSVITLNIMLHNMAGKKFAGFQPLILVLLIPLTAYHVFGVSAETEKQLTILLTAVSLAIYSIKMILLSIQWTDFCGKPFFTIRASDIAMIENAKTATGVTSGEQNSQK